MKTYTAKAADIRHDWHLIDATGKNLGRLSSEVAQILKGKHKPIYTPNQDTGDYVVIVNAAKVAISRERLEQQVLLPPLRLCPRLSQGEPCRALGEGAGACR